MKQWLNNPYVVGGLALAAGYFVYQSVAPMLGDASEGDAESVVVAPRDDEGGSPTAPGVSSRLNASHAAEGSSLRADLAGASALGLAQRDPFHAEGRVEKTQALVMPLRKPDDDSENAEALPKLTAVVDGPSSRYAVLDAQIVAKGSVVGQFIVKEISGNFVSLSGPGGQRVLSLVPGRQGVGND